MPAVRRAVIDVGTNSVKVLVADVSGHDVQPVWEESKQTRLGSGFYETHELQPEPVARTARAVAKFHRMARELQAVSVRVVGTSAARDATNAQLLVDAIEAEAGAKTEIISGAQEAEWAFRGVTTDPRFGQGRLLILDIGGGSTEFVLGEQYRKHFQESFSLGTLRLLEKVPHSDPPLPAELAACREWVHRVLSNEVAPRLNPALSGGGGGEAVRNATQLVGTGGTVSILARIEAGLEDFDRERMDGLRISREQVRLQAERLWSMPLAERQKVVGLPPKRADVILTGVLILEGVLDCFGFPEMCVSTRGLRFAAVLDSP